MALYIGFDCSTQSLTTVVLEDHAGERRIVLRDSLLFDEALPRYGTRHGVLPPSAGGVVHAPPLMWAEALALALERVSRQIDRSAVRGLSGSAQQHGSVYCNAGAAVALEAMAGGAPLAPQLHASLSRPSSPTWMDISAEAESREIEGAVGGAAALAALTGSRAFPRFTGPQIRKFARDQPEAYRATARVHLVSSWLASLLIGRHAPLDHGDASGMNLMDIRKREWSGAALEATAVNLLVRLPALTPSSSVIGRLSPTWQTGTGLPGAPIVAWTGDNPSSLVGTGLVREGVLAVSLGTSDTIFGLVREPRVSADGTGHLFAAPTGDYMGLTVFRNGSLARERVRDRFGLDWDGFSAALRNTPAGNRGAMMLPWFEPEITPAVAAASPRTFDLDPADAAANVRALIEAQMLAMARHAAWMGVEVRDIHATGGAAANAEILQIMADVFNAVVHRFDTTDSAALGAAIRANHAVSQSSARPLSWAEAVRGVAEPIPESSVHPIPAHAQIYRALREAHARRERKALAET